MTQAIYPAENQTKSTQQSHIKGQSEEQNQYV